MRVGCNIDTEAANSNRPTDLPAGVGGPQNLNIMPAQILLGPNPSKKGDYLYFLPNYLRSDGNWFYDFAN